MKIISKYKDFYDYLVQDNEPNMTYIRQSFFTKENLFHLMPKEIMTSDRKYYNDIYYKYDISIHNITFGIYPYVYSSPYMMIKIRANWGYEHIPYFFSKEDLKKIRTAEDLEKFAKKQAREYCKKNNEFKALKKYTYFTNCKGHLGNDIIDFYTKKVECKKVFEYIKAPIICEYDSKITPYSKFIHGVNYFELNHAKFLINISFTKLNSDIIRFWKDELLDINTYNNIENFLYTITQEPISNPDNNTKILSHGFDLKTSFRNIK